MKDLTLAEMGRLATLMAATLFFSSVQADKTLTLHSGENVLHLHLDSEQFEISTDALVDWVLKSADSVTRYYGDFPVPSADITLHDFAGGGVRTGKSFRDPDPRITIDIGTHSEQIHLDNDWIMVHEMVHLAFPSMYGRHGWIEEGLATYVESIARVRTGELTPEFVWKGFMDGMPHGLPREGDRGLDLTPTWGRTYWGGALFCLLADIEVLRRTELKFGLREALAAISQRQHQLKPGVPLETVLEIGDTRTGVPVLMEQYWKMATRPVHTDLDQLWRDLGVIATGDGVEFDDSAPLAPIRRAITARYR